MHRGLHHWKARTEAVKNIPSVNSKTGVKVLFQHSIMGIKKSTAIPLYTRPNFVTWFGAIDQSWWQVING